MPARATWLSGRIPYSRHRTRVARAVGVSERELWPDVEIPAPPKGGGRLELVGAFARSSDMLAPDWRTLLKDARERIELLDFTLIEILSAPNIPDLLAAKANAGCPVRLLISYATRSRLATDTPLDEPYEDDEPAAAYEIARARGYIEPLLQVPGVQARKFAAMRFNSIVRCDEQMLVTLHLWGTPSQHAPLIHLRQADHPGLSTSSRPTTNRSGSTPPTRSNPNPTGSMRAIRRARPRDRRLGAAGSRLDVARELESI